MPEIEPRSKFREFASSALTLLTVMAFLGCVIFLANSCRALERLNRPARKLVCPHCGEPIKVVVEPEERGAQDGSRR